MRPRIGRTLPGGRSRCSWTASPGRCLSWKIRWAGDRTNRTFEHQNSDRNSVTIQEILSEFIGNSEIWGFVNIFQIISQNSEKFSLKLVQNSTKIAKKSRFFIKFQQKCEKVWRNLRRFWASSGAKVRQSCRSRKTLQNEYLVAKIGVDTAENDPSKFAPITWRRKTWACLSPRGPELAPSAASLLSSSRLS